MKLDFSVALPENVAEVLKIFETSGEVTCTVGVDADWKHLTVSADVSDMADVD